MPALAGDGTAAQHRAAEEMLAATAAGDPAAMAQAIHENELELLRKNLMSEMKLQADRNETLLRDRLFGSGMPLSEIERLTPQNFFVALARRLRFSGRVFERVEWLEAVPDSGGMVLMVGRAKPPKDMGTVRVPVLVSIMPWGKDWKATIPLELQAQIDDLRTGRTRVPTASSAVASTAAPASATASSAAPSTPASAGSPQIVLALLQTAEDNLRMQRCDDYYNKQMSPNFRRTIAAKALRALITSCESRAEVRERLMTALRLARQVVPRFEYAGTRAIYDLRGQGLPFDSLALELIDKQWYIAE
ncbi:MAG TPA: hypothetical protein VN645_06000 [Steroidobacteraceae bacterium]|nr:hypothetical protein [Steroidobacteraceae bacterium]